MTKCKEQGYNQNNSLEKNEALNYQRALSPITSRNGKDKLSNFDTYQKSCPPWFYRYYNNSSSKCECGQNIHQIICCNETLQTSAVLDCYCVTYDENGKTTVAGACFYNCELNNKGIHHDMVYNTLPSTLPELKGKICGRFNRTGQLCGQCVDDFYPLAYSYNASCIYCPNGNRNWWKYIYTSGVFTPDSFLFYRRLLKN